MFCFCGDGISVPELCLCLMQMWFPKWSEGVKPVCVWRGMSELMSGFDFSVVVGRLSHASFMTRMGCPSEIGISASFKCTRSSFAKTHATHYVPTYTDLSLEIESCSVCVYFDIGWNIRKILLYKWSGVFILSIKVSKNKTKVVFPMHHVGSILLLYRRLNRFPWLKWQLCDSGFP